jgi:PBP1b-binding outer membrane lipoprotein LpoB
MKQNSKLAMLALAAVLLGGCAAGQKMGWGKSQPPATEVQVASCDAATATLTGRPDHDVAHRACVHAKARQQVD